jgi:hypothetical protein
MPPRSGPRQGKSLGRSEEHKRLRIATEAARIMAEEGVRDFQIAKRKAAARLNLAEVKNLPGNDEVQAALSEHLQLFHQADLARNTRRLREVAAEAMRFLAVFEPRLVGHVLSGTVTPASEVQLHLSADSPEQVGLFLQDHHIPFRLTERRIRFGGDRYKNVSAYHFTADEVPIELCVFDPRAAREAPLSPVDGKPMQRANLRETEELLGRR